MAGGVKTDPVLVVPATRVPFLQQLSGPLPGMFQAGFHPAHPGWLDTLLEKAEFRPRNLMEEDPTYKQIIPYCLVKFRDVYFHYARAKISGEQRLVGKRSVGVGGHVEELDLPNPSTEAGTLARAVVSYRNAVRRELMEELSLEYRGDFSVAGVLYDDSNAVGQVHLGIVHVVDMSRGLLTPNADEGLVDGQMSAIWQLIQLVDQFETWSQIWIRHAWAFHQSVMGTVDEPPAVL